MTRHRAFRLLLLFMGAAALGLSHSARAQVNPADARANARAPQARPSAQPQASANPATALLQAIQNNPLTAPYRISATLSNGKLSLRGKVATRRVHDEVIAIAIASGLPFRDDLVIDTAEAHRVAGVMAAANANAAARGGAPLSRAAMVPSLGAMPYTLGNLPYVYPPPLFGRLDDPFFGMEPPLLSYPPWWAGVAARDGIDLPGQPAGAPAGGPQQDPATHLGPGDDPRFPQAGAPNQLQAAGQPAAQAADPAAAPIQLPIGPNSNQVIEMTLDQRGVAVLRGTVPTLEDRVLIGQKLARLPGIVEIVNLLDVPDARADGNVGAVPPPPQPDLIEIKPPDAARPAAGQPAAAPAANPPPAARAPQRAAIAVDAGALSERLTQAFARRPALANLPIRVGVREGVATITGSVPSVYEAMLVYRTVQQTPGVNDVVDRLSFVVPDGEKKNPLREKGRPDDVEPYLAAQIRRQVGDIAHVDAVRVRGDILEVRGTMLHAEDQPRLNAILRSMPVLRDFRLEPSFVVD
jgi:osmotically-inducible protein OsmY